eukprot:GILJ01026129.1.p2 GENE.GILJ01026129.1~~GILJ01026129.1.p2  ORF type:complete len:184 (+),score=8.11 GILJ01026129.1:679-1230(+)
MTKNHITSIRHIMWSVATIQFPWRKFWSYISQKTHEEDFRELLSLLFGDNVHIDTSDIDSEVLCGNLSLPVVRMLFEPESLVRWFPRIVVHARYDLVEYVLMSDTVPKIPPEVFRECLTRVYSHPFDRWKTINTIATLRPTWIDKQVESFIVTHVTSSVDDIEYLVKQCPYFVQFWHHHGPIC